MVKEQDRRHLDLVEYLSSLSPNEARDVIDAILKKNEAEPEPEMPIFVPELDLPGERRLPESELLNPSKLAELRDWAREHKKRIIITSSAVAGVVVLGIGAAYMFAHILDKNPKADITDL